MNNKSILPPENAIEMTAEFLRNPLLGEIIRESSAMLLDSIDNNYFSKAISEEENGLVKIIQENFKERDPLMEIRIYKTQHLLYAMLKVFEKAGLISFNRQKNGPEQIREQAMKIWTDYKKKTDSL